MTSAREPNAKRVALVIGSGAVKCAAALGLWKVLIREGIVIPYIIEEGTRAAEEQLPYIHRLLAASREC